MADSFTDSGRLLKMEVDYSASVDEKIPICERLAKEGKLQEALDILLALEKQTRTGADTHSTSRVLVAIVKLCFEAKNYSALNEYIIQLTKRRSQIKQSVTKMIQECCNYVDLMPDKETKLKYIDTLRNVTAGKIYVEVERARLTHKLALMKEAEGNVEEAANILHELQVETFGSMEKREKVELILEQMRLCLAKKDFVRTQIISKKIHTKYFDDESTQDLKFKYYKLMIELDEHEGSYLNICKHFMAVYNSPSIQADPAKKLEVLKNSVIYIILSPYNNEQSDLIHRIKQEKALEEIALYRDIIKLFTTNELINWRGFVETYEQAFRMGVKDCPATNVFKYDEPGNKRWVDLKTRVVEHNIRTMAKYYSRISLQRMSELLDLSKDETEEMLSNLVVNKIIWAKVDRLVGLVNFSAHKDPNEVLNDWSKNIDSLMNLVGKTNHLINKEEMIHQNIHVKKSETSA